MVRRIFTYRAIGVARRVLKKYESIGVTRPFTRTGRLTKKALSRVWELDNFNRGRAIELHLKATEYTKKKGWLRLDDLTKAENFELLDFQKGLEAISVKSTTGPLSALESEVADLATRGYRSTFNGTPFEKIVLDVRVPGPAEGAEELIKLGQQLGVEVRVKTFP